MQKDDRENRIDDDSAPRPQDGDTRTQEVPLVRLLANPRRVRRA